MENITTYLNYKEQYNLLINKYKNNPIKLKEKECHHILPRSCGGTNKKENLIFLSPKDHFIAHYFLLKIYEEENDKEKFTKMLYTWNMMSNFKKYKDMQIDKIYEYANEYEELKKKAFKLISEKNKEHYLKIKDTKEFKEREIKRIEKLNYFYTTEEGKQLKKERSLASSGKNNPMYGKNAYANKTEEEMKEIGQKIRRKLKYEGRANKIPCTNFMTDKEIQQWKENLSKTFSGKNNPRYGHSPYEKMSKEEFEKMKERRSKLAKERWKNKPLKWYHNNITKTRTRISIDEIPPKDFLPGYKFDT